MLSDQQFLNRLGKNIKDKRITTFGARSKRTLSASSGVADMTIFRIENGEVSPTITTLRSIASALNCEVGELLP